MGTFLIHINGVVATLRTCKLPVFVLLLLLQSWVTLAQVSYTESFDTPTSTLTMPLGWSQGRYGSGNDIDNMWDRVTTGTLPTCAPRTGSAMIRYQSRIINNGEASFLASKRFDMRTIPAGGTPVSFWMFRDGGFPSNGDRVNVYVNATPDMAGTPVLLNETSSSSTVVNRSCSLVPLAPLVCGAWNQCTYTIPQTWNTNNVYIIIVATSAAGNNIFIDDFSVNSYPKSANQSLVTSTPVVFNQNSALISKNTTNQHIIGMRITMDGNYTPRVLTNMEFNTNGTTSAATDITNAKLWFTGGTPAFDLGNAILMGTVAQPWMTNYMFLIPPVAGYSGLASINTLQHGDNYFWITYDIPNSATSNNYVDAEWIGFKLTGSAYTPSVYTVAGSRQIGSVYCTPTFTMGTSWQNYSNNDYINNVTLAGNLVPGINNSQNIISSYAGPLCPLSYPANCPFQTHPSDYEMIPATTGKTTAITANGVTVYTISLQVGTFGSGNSIAAWIDFNKNSVFEPSEKISQSGLLGPLGVHTTTFTVPIGAIPGETRMRVREVWLDTNIDPCNHRFFGETEDYTVSIVRDCTAPAGWTTWLGFTSDWSDPSNWCPGTAPVFGIGTDVNVIIPGGPSASGYTYHKPVIKSGVLARTLKLSIQNSDTLYVNAPVSGSLTVLDSLIIRNSSSALVVKSSFLDTAQVFNGLLNHPAESPLRNFQRSRSLMLFTAAELQSKGLIANDEITHLRMHLQRKSNGNAYKNLTIKLYYTTPGFNFTSGPTGFLPPLVGPAPVTVYSGDLNTASYIPAANGWGAIEIPLASAFKWNGSGNQIVVEICYDNTGYPLTGAHDEIRCTQTTSFRKYMILENLTDYPKAGCDILPSDYFNSTASGTNGTPTITIDPAIAPLVFPGAKVFGSGPFNGSIDSYVQSISGNVVTLTSNVLSTFSNGTLTFYNTNNLATNYRPNVTFKFNRPFQKYPIFVGGNWQNNGSFVPAISRVTLNGSVQQKIDGTANTNFYDLKIQNPYHVMRMADFSVADSLQIIIGRLKLNNGTVTLTNSSPSALTYVINAGDIQAETDLPADNAAPYGRLAWDLNTQTGPRTIPFINAAGVRIPLNYNIDSGTHQMVFGTYATAPDNNNWPQPDVTNIFGMNNAAGGGWGASGWSMIDRYYLIQNSAPGGGQADITFRYAAGEQAQSGNFDMRAQRWVNSGSIWEFPFQPNQAFTPGNPNEVVLPDFTGFSTGSWWTVTGETSPLPVSLLEFTARKYNDKVKLSWTTASEIDNSHFIVERTLDNDDFKFIGRVNSQGSGNNTQHYETWDNYPVDGVQYYYLRQYDNNGTMVPYGPVAVNFQTDLFEIVQTIISPTDQHISVVFNYNSDEPCRYRIMDMTGRMIYSRDKNEAVQGVNVFDVNLDLSRGAYYMVLENSSKVITRKFFY